MTAGMRQPARRAYAGMTLRQPSSTVGLPRPFAYPRTRGFTLLEMLAVILLIGIAAAATAISVTHGLASARIDAASSELAAALRATRTQAVVHGAERSFVLDTRNDSYHGANGREVTLPRGMRVGITSASMDQGRDGIARIRFFPDGSSTGGRITLESGRRQWHVDVSWLTGGVSVVDMVPK